jgi:hypothetical protein
LARH